MLDKDDSIIYVVDYLLKRFGATEILVKDHWDADLCAIGLTDKSGQYLIYISTYGRNKNKYFISLETHSDDKIFPDNSDGEFDDLTLEELEGKLISHFKFI